MELTVPLGYRRGAAAVRNAELQLSRSRALLREQEHLVLHGVAAAVAETERAYVVSQTTYNRLDAARNQLDAIRAAFESDKAPLDLLLDAQRRLAEAESRYFRSLAEYAVAVKNVHYAKGTLLDYDGVYLSEGGWPMAAYQDAAIRENRRGKPHPLNYASSHSTARRLRSLRTAARQSDSTSRSNCQNPLKNRSRIEAYEPGCGRRGHRDSRAALETKRTQHADHTRSSLKHPNLSLLPTVDE